jgi:hypothetical protein
VVLPLPLVPHPLLEVVPELQDLPLLLVVVHHLPLALHLLRERPLLRPTFLLRWLSLPMAVWACSNKFVQAPN